MKYSFINLDSCAERREFVVDNFSKFSHGNKNIDRVSAININHVIDHGVSGTAKPSEKACYLSHYKAIQFSLSHNDHVFIAEDDVLFCDQSTIVIEKAIDSFGVKPWDIVYTDICFQHIDSMVSFFSSRRQFEQDREIRLFDLSNRVFSGATAYIINRSSKQKILDILPTHSLDYPIDLILRKLILDKKINGYVLFPFPTSLSRHAENSQIQIGDDLIPDFLFNTYRRLIWLGRDIKEVSASLNQIDSNLYDEDSDAFCALLRALMSKKIKTK